MNESAAAPLPRTRVPFVALLTANAISLVGSQFTTLSVPWFVLQTTGSATKTGVTAAVTALSFLASLFGGALVDRLGFKRVSVAADLTSGIAVALIPLLYHTVGLSFPQLLGLVFLRAFCNTPGGTARMAMLPDFITLAGLSKERANGTYTSVISGAQLVGTASVGVLIALIGASNMLWLDGVSFLVSATVVAFVVPSQRPLPALPPAASSPITRQCGRYRAELGQGIQWLWGNGVLRAITLTATVVNLVGTAVIAVILPVYAKTVYGTAVAFGLLFTGFSVGTLAGSLIYAAVGSRLPRRATFVIAVAMLGVPLLVLVAPVPLVVATLALGVVGCFNAPLNTVFAVVEQERIPKAMRGRVLGVIGALGNVAAPLGGLLGGVVIGVVGIRVTLLGAAVILIAAGAGALGNRALRAMQTPAQ